MTTSKKRVSRKKVSKKRLNRRRASKKRVSRRRTSKKRVSRRRTSKKRVSRRKVYNYRANNNSANNSNINIRIIIFNAVYNIEISQDKTVKDLKRKISLKLWVKKRINLSWKQQELKFGKKLLNNNDVLKEYNIDDDDSILLFFMSTSLILLCFFTKMFNRWRENIEFRFCDCCALCLAAWRNTPRLYAPPTCPSRPAIQSIIKILISRLKLNEENFSFKDIDTIIVRRQPAPITVAQPSIEWPLYPSHNYRKISVLPRSYQEWCPLLAPYKKQTIHYYIEKFLQEISQFDEYVEFVRKFNDGEIVSFCTQGLK